MSPRADNLRIDRILKSVWDAAVLSNPMLLTRLRTDYLFDRLREMIRDCLAKGLSETETRLHTVKVLFQSANTGQQPPDHCSEAASQNEPVS